MTEAAVNFAWGKPAGVPHAETEQGRETIWMDYAGWMEKTRYWASRWINARGEAQPTQGFAEPTV